VRASLDELARLVDTAGAAVVGELVQKRGGPTPSTLLSKGKVEELKGLVAQTAADTVACDDDLTPAQVRNLEKVLEQARGDSHAKIRIGMCAPLSREAPNLVRVLCDMMSNADDRLPTPIQLAVGRFLSWEKPLCFSYGMADAHIFRPGRRRRLT